MSREQESQRTQQCIRCDEETPVGYENLGEHVPLTFNHESGALPICRSCFQEVSDRDIWS